MNKSNYHIYLVHINKYFLILSILWMCLIFALSHRPADVSSNDSLVFSEIIEIFLPSHVEPETFASNLGFESFNGFVRKLAHFSIYAVLGILLYFTVNTPTIPKPLLLLPWQIATFYAITDELHQYFIPGRSCQISDIILDSLGALSGILVIHLIYQKVIGNKSSKLS